MKQKQISGMRLRLKEDPRGEKLSLILAMAVMLVSSLVTLMSLAHITGFDGKTEIAAMLAAAGLVCLVYGLLMRVRQEGWVYVIALLLACLVVLVYRSQVLEGFRLFWRDLGRTLVLGTGWVLPQWQLLLPEAQHGLCRGLFAAVVGLLAAEAVCFLSSRCPWLLSVVMLGSTMAGMDALGMELSFRWILAVAATAVMLVLWSGWNRGTNKVSILSGWALAAALGAVALIAVSMPGVKAWTDNVEKRIHQSHHARKYETSHTTLPEGDFTDYTEEKKGAEAALIVTMDNPQSMFLRGFTGGVFENNRWKPLSTDILQKNEELLYWLNCNAFDPNAQYEAALMEGTQFGSVTVQNIGACSFYRYVPYGLSRGDAPAAENLNTWGVEGHGQRTYTYDATPSDGRDILDTARMLSEATDSKVVAYRQAETAYRQFVRSFYLQIPEEARTLLESHWVEAETQFASAETAKAQQCVLAVLSRCFPETGTPEELALPLDIARGTSYQYATVAALTLRYFGIPARYAEGYVITPTMAESVFAGEPLTVDSSCARAWVEIYQDGLGWIPMEVSPGLGEMVRQESDDTLGDNQGEEEDEDLDPEDAPEENPMEQEEPVASPQGGSVVQLLRAWILRYFKYLAIVLLILLMVVMRRKWILKKREECFRDENIREAVGWIFAHTVVLMEQLGLKRGNGSVRSLVPAAEVFGQAFAQALIQATDANDLALFSTAAMEEEHRLAAMQLHGQAIDHIGTHVRWYRRLWMKWVRCLY